MSHHNTWIGGISLCPVVADEASDPIGNGRQLNCEHDYVLFAYVIGTESKDILRVIIICLLFCGSITM